MNVCKWAIKTKSEHITSKIGSLKLKASTIFPFNNLSFKWKKYHWFPRGVGVGVCVWIGNTNLWYTFFKHTTQILSDRNLLAVTPPPSSETQLHAYIQTQMLLPRNAHQIYFLGTTSLLAPDFIFCTNKFPEKVLSAGTETSTVTLMCEMDFFLISLRIPRPC